MSKGKTAWFWWCFAWALFWITLGWFILPLINVFLFVLSIVAMIPSFIGNKVPR